jgi:hypothetical protein
MFKIIVDNIEKGVYSDNCGAVTVGSAADADVCLPSAAAEHIKIYPLHGSFGGCFKVTVHARDGMTHYTKKCGKWHIVQWKPNPPYWLAANCETQNLLTIHGREKPGWVLVDSGDSLLIGDHKIQVINC